jgi:WD repeat-containing protein 35
MNSLITSDISTSADK